MTQLPSPGGKPSRSTRRPERSDSGPVGFQVRKAIGLDDPESLDEVSDATKAAIQDRGLENLIRKERGGYGVVCKAIDRRTGNPRAVKVVLPPYQEDRLKVFKRECDILDSPEMPAGLAPKYYASHAGNVDLKTGMATVQPFMILEWVDGKNLDHWLLANPALSMADRESLCRAIFHAYAQLHAANLIQRDPSLGNIMISGRKIRLIDFGGGGRAINGYRNGSTLSKVPTTHAFASNGVLNGERKPTIPDEIHSVAKICFTVLTGKMAAEHEPRQWPVLLRQHGVEKDIAEIILARMQEPPNSIVAASQPQEY